MITIRRAKPADAAEIAAVHITAWRSAYPGILPADYLAGLSFSSHAAQYESAIRDGVAVHVAVWGSPGRIVGFASAVRSRRRALAEGEIETLYVLDDFRDKGAGRQLLAASAGFLTTLTCRSAFAWVLRENQARWFYERMGAKLVAEETLRFAGVDLMQCAYLWPDLTVLRPQARA